MYELDDISKAIQVLISKATGLPLNRVLKANQGKSSPIDEYCTYNIQPNGFIGQGWETNQELVDAVDCDIPDWKDSETTTTYYLKLRVSCNFMRDRAKDRAWMLGQCESRHVIREHLLINNIWWSGCGTPNNLTDVVQADYVTRSQIDMNLVVGAQVKDIILLAHSISWNVADELGQQVSAGETTIEE